MIKVADFFRVTEDIIYGTSYDREKGVSGNEEKAPIRWMAPESIEEDIYTEATDVVSKQFPTHSDMCEDIVSYIVVIWSDGVGDLHLWEDPILWCPCHGSSEGAAERTETGETSQPGLLCPNVRNNSYFLSC